MADLLFNADKHKHVVLDQSSQQCTSNKAGGAQTHHFHAQNAEGWACAGTCAQVAERSLFLWNNEYIVSLVAQQRTAVLPLIFAALERNEKQHWNPQVRHSLIFLCAQEGSGIPILYKASVSSWAVVVHGVYSPGNGSDAW